MTKAMDKQNNHQNNNRVIRKSIKGEYLYLNQERKQIDIKSIEK
jgi:hypothetical protein